MDDRIITEEKIEEDNDTEQSIRPDSIEEYIGQKDVKENIKVFIESAKIRDESLDHVLLYDPPGLGKTPLLILLLMNLEAILKLQLVQV